jgi:predicted nucleic acid-binding protein
MIVVVDTPVWSLALRRSASDLNAAQSAHKQELAELVREGRVRLLGPVRQEVLSGIRDTAQFQRLREHLRAFPDEPLTTEDYEEAAAYGNRCRRAGIAGSAIDFLLCAAAARRKAAIFTTDNDFGRLVKHLSVQLRGPGPSK